MGKRANASRALDPHSDNDGGDFFVECSRNQGALTTAHRGRRGITKIAETKNNFGKG